LLFRNNSLILKQLEYILLNRTHLFTGFIISVIFILSGCTAGNKLGQYGQDVHTSIGNIGVNNNNEAGTLNATLGNITIGHHAMVKSAVTVNGNITIDDFSRATLLQTTNGNIVIGENVLVSGNVKTTNGNIRIKQQTEINSSVITATGDIFIAQGTTIKGSIIYEEPGFWSSQIKKKLPTLEIDNDVTINGEIHLYHPIELLFKQPTNLQKIIRHY